MKLSNVLFFAAGVYRVSALGGVGAALCLAACTPLLINPLAYAACAAGCSALGVSGDDIGGCPRFLPDGTIIFEKESSQCEEACKTLLREPLTYAACLGGCAARTEGEKK
ncbi:hypothetical protein JMJ35_005178 [Cladonia borealis]|uniref:Uncharacterized protein n=1 Tax=Cladonia borealis TaxID=184061 RepID=A0AA39QZI5_9LECA|nr:hypothetical protein JMJ35_005178 [Cladonia borealis]